MHTAHSGINACVNVLPAGREAFRDFWQVPSVRNRTTSTKVSIPSALTPGMENRRMASRRQK